MPRARVVLLLVALTVARANGPAPALAAPPGAYGALADSLDFLAPSGMSQAQVSILACSLDRGDTLVALHPAIRMIPGSNLKLFTTGSYWRAARTAPGAAPAPTTISARGKVKIKGRDRAIRLKGDLVLRGSGMPDVYQLLRPGSRGLLDSLAFLLRADGLESFEGTLWVDGTLFADEPYGPGWAYEDLVFSYAAPVGAVMANGDAASVVATAGNRGVTLSLDPPETPLTLSGTVSVGDSATPGRLSVSRALGSKAVVVSGTVPRGGITRRQVAVPEPDSAAGLDLLGAMKRAGIQVKATVRMTPRTPSAPKGGKAAAPPAPAASADSGWARVANDRSALVVSLGSPDAASVVGIVNSMSLNIEAEALLRQLDPGTPKTREGGLAQVRRMASAAGVDTLDLSLVDGSGLSPMDLVTARAVVTWLSSMAADSTLGTPFRDGLASPGGVGTLKRRFASVPGDAALRAKTGTLTNVSAVSGYLTTGDGERVVFAMLSNGNRASVDSAHAAEERLVMLLSRYRRPVPIGPPYPEVPR